MPKCRATVAIDQTRLRFSRKALSIYRRLPMIPFAAADWARRCGIRNSLKNRVFLFIRLPYTVQLPEPDAGRLTLNVQGIAIETRGSKRGHLHLMGNGWENRNTSSRRDHASNGAAA
jgi:hypothetical protein